MQGRETEPMPTVDSLVARKDLDCIAICSPAAVHEAQIRAAVKNGLHIFCEKPLIWGPVGTLATATAGIVGRCFSSGLVLHENTQWTYTLPVFWRAHGSIAQDQIKSIEVELSPPVLGPEQMLREAFAHPASLVIQATDGDSLERIRVVSGSRDLTISADVTAERRRLCTLRVRFAYAESQPRPAAYALNGFWLRRRIGEGYRIYFEADGVFHDCPDPLESSVLGFVEAVRNVKAGSRPSRAERSIRIARMTDAVRGALTASNDPLRGADVCAYQYRRS
jgi:hypothetical protein